MGTEYWGGVIIIWLICAAWGAQLASSRGGQAVGGGIAGLIFGPLGVLYVWWTTRPEQSYTVCPHCRERIHPEASICPHCRLRVAPRGGKEGGPRQSEQSV